jgi:branched-chain amino acid transport system substrate-binding protein
MRGFLGRAALTLALVGLGAGSALAAETPIKIGILHTFSGPLAVVGIDATNGFTLYFDEIGNRAAGREITLLKEDDAAIPSQGMERTRRLVEREHVDILTGITNSAVAYAVRDYINQRQVPLVVMGSAGANDITDKLGSPYIFRTSFSNRQLAGPFGDYACKTLGYRRIVVMASDFVTGLEQSAAFEASYRKAGCEVVKEIRPPLGTVDFAPFLSQIEPDRSDAVWAMFFAADAIAFVKQYDAFGLKGKLPLVGSGGFVDQSLLPAMGASSLGIVVSNQYSPYLDTAENKRFVDNFRQHFGNLPGTTAMSGYVAAKAIAMAIEAVHGDIGDKPAFLAALHKVSFDSPMGPFRFDDQQNIVFGLWLFRIVERGGIPVPETIGRLASEVDQFGNFK